MSDPFPRIWVLLGHRRGDNLQLLALAEALGLPFETRTVGYSALRRLDTRLLGNSLAAVRPSARKWLQPPWPDLIIGIGHRSVPVARWIRARSGGNTKLVQLGNPRVHPRHFDLVITTPQYPERLAQNVLRLPFAMASPHGRGKPNDEERAFLDALPRPHRLLVLGGPTRLWELSGEDVADAARQLVDRCAAEGGALIAVASPRTTDEMIQAVEGVFDHTRHCVVSGSTPRYAILLKDADELYVTADSVSMLSEAVFTGKPVGMIPVRPSQRGRMRYALADRGLWSAPYPNLKNMWAALQKDGLVGTLARPRSGVGQDPARTAAAAVLKLLGR